MAWISLWWVWLCAALVLAILELLIPSYIFLGIAVGAAVMAGVVVVAPGLGVSTLMAIFGAVSLVSWLVLRRVFRSPDDQTRIVHEDINK
ncbi:NfeD family protein [Roseovarius phycicola]|uniref:NfeD-like C-terminal domain-containing protein n=1 Tax=Roseovarius phycicola TaxID=3080976 RepID=A0ABZ2HLP7_9RHOB